MNKKLIAGLVALVVVAGAGYFVLNGKNDDTKSTDTKSQSQTQTASNIKSSDVTTSAKQVDDACAVFTVTELMDALSISPISAGKAPSSPSKTSDGLPLVRCEWEQGSGGTADYTLDLDVNNFASVAKATSYITDTNVNAGSLSSEVVSDVADQAVLARSGTGTPVQAMIYWRKGTIVYQLAAIRMDGVDRPAMEARLKTLVANKF
jgi:hypothetical protein